MLKSSPSRLFSRSSTPRLRISSTSAAMTSRGQPIGRDAVQDHAARQFQGLEDGHLVAVEGQIVGGAEAGGATAHDGYLLAGGGSRDLARLRAVTVELVRREALQLADGYRLAVHLRPAASALAGTGAHAAYDAGQRQALLDDPDGLGVVTSGNGRDVRGYVDPRRAGIVAGGLAVGVVVRQQLVQSLPAQFRQGRVERDHFHTVEHAASRRPARYPAHRPPPRIGRSGRPASTRGSWQRVGMYMPWLRAARRTVRFGSTCRCCPSMKIDTDWSPAGGYDGCVSSISRSVSWSRGLARTGGPRAWHRWSRGRLL